MTKRFLNGGLSLSVCYPNICLYTFCAPFILANVIDVFTCEPRLTIQTITVQVLGMSQTKPIGAASASESTNASATESAAASAAMAAPPWLGTQLDNASHAESVSFVSFEFDSSKKKVVTGEFIVTEQPLPKVCYPPATASLGCMYDEAFPRHLMWYKTSTVLIDPVL